MTANWGGAISKNPYLSFKFKGGASGDKIKISWLDNMGKSDTAEAAIKFARRSTGRPEVIATMRGFHGRTMGALSATWDRRHRDSFGTIMTLRVSSPAARPCMAPSRPSRGTSASSTRSSLGRRPDASSSSAAARPSVSYS